MNKAMWTASLLLVTLGLAGLAAAHFVKVYRREKERFSARITARVVDLVLQKNSLLKNAQEEPDQTMNYENAYHAVFEYYADGRLYHQTDPQGFLPSKYHIGEQVTLSYDPSDPEKYEIEEGFFKRGTDIQILYGVSFFLVLLGMILFMRFALRTA